MNKSTYLYLIPLTILAVIFSNCDSSVTNSNNDPLSVSESEGNANIEIAMSGTPAYMEFTVQGTGNPPENGSVGVWYEGIKVTTHYLSTWTPQDIAWSISNTINTDSDIQLSGTVPTGSTVRLTEKRTGSEHNGNPVYVTHTNDTHITVNGYLFFMHSGTD